MAFFTNLRNKLRGNRLSVILGVFEVAKEELDEFVQDNERVIGSLQSELVSASRDQKRAVAARDKIKQILGE